MAPKTRISHTSNAAPGPEPEDKPVRASRSKAAASTSASAAAINPEPEDKPVRASRSKAASSTSASASSAAAGAEPEDKPVRASRSKAASSAAAGAEPEDKPVRASRSKATAAASAAAGAEPEDKPVRASRSRVVSGPISEFVRVDSLTNEFVLHNDGSYPTAFVNALRRIMVAEIPIYAVDRDQIQFQRHRCFLNESILGDRLSLSYLKQSPEYQWDSIELYLHVTNDSDDIRYVYLEDFQIRGPGNLRSTDLFVFPRAIFAALRPDQEIELTARCKRGTKTSDGASHTAAIAMHHFVRDEEIVQQKASEIADEFQRKAYLVGDAGRDYRRVAGSDEPEFIKFMIETTGGYPAGEVFHLALRILRQKLEAFCEAIEQRDTNKIDLVESHESFPHWDLTVFQETHTLGALLSAATLIYVGDRVSFCGYNVPHPLDGKIVMRIALKDTNDWTEIVRALTMVSRKIIESMEPLLAYRM